MSSAFNSIYHRASNAVDDVTRCSNGRSTAHTDREFNPWIQIDMLNIFDIAKVLIFNRQDMGGERLHDLLISVGENGVEKPCGFFQGPAATGDRLLIFCSSGSRGRYVRLTIQSIQGERDFLNVCEIQVFLE
ncbi:fucolectin-4-like [Ostrea edulis]|uniref:fucolectin-4-like n=1 Tax=Ostrea edulis TaxID=37623 RepID=UPI0024AEEF0D|nr:fucolectin-4-like [Ostrea edulis]